jgi:ATP-dependent helicase/DNAse subunit B
VEELLRSTEKKIVEAAARLRAGDITVRSKDCKYCKFDSLCRFEKWKQIYTEVDGV